MTIDHVLIDCEYIKQMKIADKMSKHVETYKKNNKQWKTEEIARDILMHNHHYFGEEFTHIWKVISERMKLESTKIKPLKLIKNPLKAKIENGKVYFEYEIINPLKKRSNQKVQKKIKPLKLRVKSLKKTIQNGKVYSEYEIIK